MFSEIVQLAIPMTEGKNKINRLGIAQRYAVHLSVENLLKKSIQIL